MKREILLIAGQLKDAYEGEPWFGRCTKDILDEIDSDSAEEVGWIETILYELINDANLFVVLASHPH